MDREKSVDVLNKLIEINNDRIEGYETALGETKDADLMAMFTAFIQTSMSCRSELEAEVLKMGGEPTESTKVTGKFFRAWMEVKAALSNNERKAVLNSCEHGEDVALETYQDVLKDDLLNLNPDQQSMITEQHQKLKADHDKVRDMRDVAA